MPKKQLNKILPMSLVELSGGTQQRPLDSSTVDKYVELIKDGLDFPPVEIIFDGKNHWLWDGFHRYRAHQILERKEIRANIEVGNKRDAVWYSLGANATHGLPRPYGSLKGIVMTVLNDKAWSLKSDDEIARHVHCTRQYVHALRNPESVNSLQTEPETEEEPAKEDFDNAFEQPIGSPKIIEMKDCEGQVIPHKIRENWLSRAVIQERIRDLDQIKNSVMHSIQEGQLTYCLLNQTGFQADITSLRNRLTGSLPYAICCYCNGEGCNACHNFGFLNEPSWKAAPKK
jgi:uncharacterized ParB-like nuclease family protein